VALTNESSVWRSVVAPALHVASALDGRPLHIEPIEPTDHELLLDRETLQALEFAALLVVDLAALDAPAFRLVEWLARVRPGSALLLRTGTTALPFELHELLVRTLPDAKREGGANARQTVARLATLGAVARANEGGTIAWTSPRAVEVLARRREGRGARAAWQAAARARHAGNHDAARVALGQALQADPRAADLLLAAAVHDRLAGRWHDALPRLERAVRRAPHLAAAWRELGLVRQHAGVPDARGALERAVDLADDFEALVALAVLCSREGEAERAARLYARALQISDGQLNLVLPTLEAGARSDRRIVLHPWDEERLQAVLALRAGQAQASPPEDAPWSFFDVARVHLARGRVDLAADVVRAARPLLSAPWQPQTFAASLEAYAAAGVDVAPVRAALGLVAGRSADARSSGSSILRRPFQAAPRDATWFVRNIPCMTACPVGTDAGAYVHHIAAGRLAEAFHVARAPNPFASVCGRICAAPCEDACRRGAIDAPVAIRSLKRFLTEQFGVEGTTPRVDDVLRADAAPCIEGEAYVHRVRSLERGRTGRIAVVGGGPAGLACAHDLALLGHGVTLFEGSHQLGGMMRQGIPIYRLSRDLLELEIGAILSLGVDVQLGTRLAAERGVGALLREGYDAIFLASGAGTARGLDVDGAHLDGVITAIEYLLNANQGYRAELGHRVVVVGGGNVALDVARTARLGRAPDPLAPTSGARTATNGFGPALANDPLRHALRGSQREVHVIARQPMGQWPAQRTVQGTRELDEAREEGIVFHPLRGVRRFLGENGRLVAVELAEVVSLLDEHGRYAPTYGAHVAEVLPCDVAFLAVGQEPALDYLDDLPSLERTRGGLVAVDRETLATTHPGVYAGGDAAFGPRTLIEAVGDGKRAARNIHAWLGGARPEAAGVRFEVVPARAVGTTPGYETLPRCAPPRRDVDRRTGIAEVDLGFDAEQARQQAARCLVCHVQTIYDGDLCIACGRCTDVCPHGCLSFVGPEALERPPDFEPRGDVFLVKDEDTCIRCGLCAERCPTGAMTMERVALEPGVSR
ncbi:MAG: FAD-dependent oxidoreductase, partial [Planctomycetota bacterium]